MYNFHNITITYLILVELATGQYGIVNFNSDLAFDVHIAEQICHRHRPGQCCWLAIDGYLHEKSIKQGVSG